jgi:hypothetical protein
MPPSLVTPLKNGSTTIEESNMYYVASRNQRGSGGMIIWSHIKKLNAFKATDGIEYVVAKSKKEMDRSLPIYIGVGDKLVKTRRYEITWLDEFFG